MPGRKTALRSGIFGPGVFHKCAPAKRLCGKLWRSSKISTSFAGKTKCASGAGWPAEAQKNLYGSIDAVDGDFAGKDLLLAAVGADDELAVGVHVDGRAAAQLPARQVEGDVTA